MPDTNDLPPVLERLGEDLYAAMTTADTARPTEPRRHRRFNRPGRAIARTPRPARRWAMAGVAAVAVGVGVFVLGSTGGAPTSAFAGWTATPTAPTSGETAGALQHCTSQLARAEGPQSGIPAAGWKPVLTDTRGPFTAVILQSASASATCFNGPSFTSIMASSAEGGGASEHVLSMGSASGAPPSSVSVMGLGGSGTGPISTASMSHLTTNGGQPYTFLQGQIRTGVTVALVLSNGSNVQASVGDGSFIAWWPGGADANSAHVASGPGMVTSQSLTFRSVSALKPAQGATSPLAGSGEYSTAASVARGSTSGQQLPAALAKCHSKLPPRSAPRDMTTMTKFIACMKTNGVTLPIPNPTK